MSETITHLLGYLNAKQWANAIKCAEEYADINKREIYDLIQAQQDKYGGHLTPSAKKSPS